MYILLLVVLISVLAGCGSDDASIAEEGEVWVKVSYISAGDAMPVAYGILNEEKFQAPKEDRSDFIRLRQVVVYLKGGKMAPLANQRESSDIRYINRERVVRIDLMGEDFVERVLAPLSTIGKP
jgi:hypothetical protein